MKWWTGGLLFSPPAVKRPRFLVPYICSYFQLLNQLLTLVNLLHAKLKSARVSIICPFQQLAETGSFRLILMPVMLMHLLPVFIFGRKRNLWTKQARCFIFTELLCLQMPGFVMSYVAVNSHNVEWNEWCKMKFYFSLNTWFCKKKLTTSLKSCATLWTKGEVKRKAKDNFLPCISKRRIHMVKLCNKSDDGNYSLNTLKFQLKDEACWERTPGEVMIPMK